MGKEKEKDCLWLCPSCNQVFDERDIKRNGDLCIYCGNQLDRVRV